MENNNDATEDLLGPMFLQDEHDVDMMLLSESFDDEQECIEQRKAALSPMTVLWERNVSTRHGPAVVARQVSHEDDDPWRANNATMNLKPAPASLTVGLHTLPEDLLAYTACFLNVGSLKQARLVSRKCNRVLSTDRAGWIMHVARLAQRRLHVHLPITSNTNASAKDVYRLACTDARLRHAVRREELIYNPTPGGNGGTIWSFRFKEVSGTEWTQGDPWYQGRPARQMVFLADGVVRQVERRQTRDDHGNQSTTIVLHPPFYDAPNLPSGLNISWRFVNQPIDLPRKEPGAYVRLTIAGRDVPTYMVHRSPCGSWGFLMENCWGLFASFDLPPKPDPPVVRPVVPRMRLRRDSHGGARWLDVSQDESDDEDEEVLRAGNPHHHHDAAHHQQHPEHVVDKSHLLQDASLNVTCRWQWREALLYNLGASVLPDGPNATREFNRAWQLSMRSMQSFGFPTPQSQPRRQPQHQFQGHYRDRLIVGQNANARQLEQPAPPLAREEDEMFMDEPPQRQPQQHRDRRLMRGQSINRRGRNVHGR